VIINISVLSRSGDRVPGPAFDLFEVKSVELKYRWDDDKLVATMAADDAFIPLAGRTCRGMNRRSWCGEGAKVFA
jgi:hypothetical protein